MGDPTPGTVVMVDPIFGTEVINDTSIPNAEVYQALSTQSQGLIAALGNWASNTRGNPNSRRGSLFQRDRYVTPFRIFDQMRAAYDAAENDDVVSGVMESTEALAFGKMAFHADDIDEQDIYNQIAEDIDLDSRMREMWRELFTVSQFYAAVWWERKQYKVTGKGRKKTFNITAPTGITILDPLKILPLGMPMFNRERLVWMATQTEWTMYEDIERRAADPIMQRLLLGPYEPTLDERRWIGDLGLDVDSSRLFELNPANVFRHTATRPQYHRMAAVRMKTVFPLLDLKEQLRAMDRAHLIGGTNFIVLITQGSDTNPAKPEEIAHLQASVRVVAQSPVLVGDHRLDVQIVTPKQDATLDQKRYDTLDVRISARLFQMFVRTTSGDRADKGSDLVKVVAAGMESRRKMLRRALEKNVLKPLFDRNDNLLTKPNLEFHPKSIAMDFNADMASFMLSLREQREISRYTILNQFEFDEDFEAEMLKREKEFYDDIFQTINPNNQGQPGSTVGPKPATVPAVAPVKKATQSPRRAGRRDGGSAPGTGQGKAPVKRAGIKKRAATAEEEPDDDED